MECTADTMIIFNYIYHVGTCQNLNILMVSNSSTGMKILLTSAANNSTSASASVNISNHYLPPECRNRNLCSILDFESNRFSYYIIPSIRGFVILSHRTNHTAIQITFVNIAEECNPMKAFHDGTAEGHTAYVYNIVVACTDLQIQPRGIIYYYFTISFLSK